MTPLLQRFVDKIAEQVDQVLHSTGLQRVIQENIDAANATNDYRLLTLTLNFDQLDPLAVLERLADKNQLRYYWEKPDQDLSIAASGSVMMIEGSGAERFQQISEQIHTAKTRHSGYSVIAHTLAGLQFVGGFSFFDRAAKGDWQAFGAARFSVPEWILIREGRLSLLTIAQRILPGQNYRQIKTMLENAYKHLTNKLSIYHRPESASLERPDQLTFEPEDQTEQKARWHTMIHGATHRIREGKLRKVVLARAVNVTTSSTICDTHLLHHLRREYPGCYSFLIQFPDSASFIGCTPERLISVQSGFYSTEGLAGSTPRGLTATDDSILEKRLLLSDKDQEEHRYVVESIVQRLGAFTDKIQYAKHPGIRKFANVQHLYTPITARIAGDTNPLNVLAGIHPTPAVGGAPTSAALLLIQESEDFDRGWYAGPVGWINAQGRGEFVVAIRSGLINDKKATFFAGCGIVESSVPEHEWAETELKLIPMLTALRHG
jgi:menaquinone-specific isochorismate synthase